MPWVRLDDHFDEHPKIAAVGPLGIALWVTGLAYCNRNLTDGFIPWTVARNLLSWEYLAAPDEQGRQRRNRISISCGMVGDDADSDTVIDLLIDAGIWDEVDGGYHVHDFGEYQPTKEAVLAEREAARTRMGRKRANTERTSDDVRGNFGGTSVAPVPVPVPVPEPSDPTDQITHTTRAKKPRVTVVDEPFIAEMVARHSTIPADRVREEIADALGHKAAAKRTDLQAYVRVWLSRTSWSAPSRNGHQPATYASTHGQSRGADVWDGLVHRD